MTPLKQKRVSLGMTLTEFAEKCGVSISSATGWEQGTRQPSAPRYPLIASILNIGTEDVARLVSETEKERRELSAHASA